MGTATCKRSWSVGGGERFLRRRRRRRRLENDEKEKEKEKEKET